MSINTILTILNLLVAIIGVCLVLLAYNEFRYLNRLKKSLEEIEGRLEKRLYRLQRGLQRVMASYAAEDPNKKIALLKAAIADAPETFNAYNALGYAYLEQGKTLEAIDAFKDAINLHPDDKAGYQDLAYAYLKHGRRDLCLEYLKRSIECDPTAREDIANNPLFQELKDDPALKRLLS